MYKIKTLSNSFVVQEYNIDSKLVRQFGLKKGAATYKVENNLLKLYYYNDWFYKQPIASMDLPVEVDGIMYSANSISQGLKNIFKSSSNGGGDEAIVVDTEFNTESANPIANAPVATAINSIENKIKLEIERSNKADVERKLADKLDVSAYTPYDDTTVKADIAKKADKSYVDSELVKKQDKGNYVDSEAYENQIAELKAQLRELEELIQQSGKIDDVYVNGKSVVTDKIANIDMYTKAEIDDMIASASFMVTRDGNTINIFSNSSYVKDGTLVMNTSRAREENNTLYFS